MPSAVRWPIPARMNPVTVSSSPITPISLVPSLIFADFLAKICPHKVRFAMVPSNLSFHPRKVRTAFLVSLGCQASVCVKMLATNVPATQQHLQGLVTRRAAPVDASNPAAYFGHVADAVRANDEITTLRYGRVPNRLDDDVRS